MALRTLTEKVRGSSLSAMYERQPSVATVRFLQVASALLFHWDGGLVSLDDSQQRLLSLDFKGYDHDYLPSEIAHHKVCLGRAGLHARWLGS